MLRPCKNVLLFQKLEWGYGVNTYSFVLSLWQAEFLIMQRTLGSLRSNEIPTFAICAWTPFAWSALTADSADAGVSKSTNP